VTSLFGMLMRSAGQGILAHLPPFLTAAGPKVCFDS
jgi:hypothetical protein